MKNIEKNTKTSFKFKNLIENIDPPSFKTNSLKLGTFTSIKKSQADTNFEDYEIKHIFDVEKVNNLNNLVIRFGKFFLKFLDNKY